MVASTDSKHPTSRLFDPAALQAENASLRAINARLKDEIDELTRCGTCSKRLKGTCIFPCGHSVWCEVCTLRNLSIENKKLEDGRLTELYRGQTALKFYCPLSRCATRIESVIRVRPSAP
jgi:hypothetical protein